MAKKKMRRLAITAGDPGGIGPEVVVKALASGAASGCIPVVIGDATVMASALKLCKCSLELTVIRDVNDARCEPGRLWLMDQGLLKSFRKRTTDADNGRAAVAAIRSAAALAMAREVSAVVTAPISKEALKLAGFPWPGHTELLAELTGTEDFAMMLAGGPLRVILATIHTRLRDVPDLITRTRVLRTIRLARKACAMMGLSRPKIAVAGLNPHAGESGLFGSEEGRSIAPAVEEAKEEGINALGPFPPDTVFHKAYRGEVDIVVCMYHDQGLIPLKMIAFDSGVNVTVGLPIIRTSPDHGTAYDIAWKGKADPASMIAAIKMALSLKLTG